MIKALLEEYLPSNQIFLENHFIDFLPVPANIPPSYLQIFKIRTLLHFYR